VVWTSLHIQYDWFYRSEIFAVGLVLGYWRYRSGSTWLTTMAHTFMNVASVVETLLLLAYGT